MFAGRRPRSLIPDPRPKMLGILSLDTAFPRIKGDVGAPDTFDFPVRARHRLRLAGRRHRPSRQRRAVPAASCRRRSELVEQGCIGIATTCGFLVRWQRELTAELDVPVLTSALLMLPLVQRCLPRHRKVGVVTYSAAALSPQRARGGRRRPVHADRGRGPRRLLRAHDPARRRPSRSGPHVRADVVAAARRLVSTHTGRGRDRARVRQHAAVPGRGGRGDRAAGVRRGAAHHLVPRGHRRVAPRRYARHNLW